MTDDHSIAEHDVDLASDAVSTGHLSCSTCDPMGFIGLCGSALTQPGAVFSGDVTCAVCLDIEQGHCPRCLRSFKGRVHS